MKLPFTFDQFLEVFNNYNLAVFPMQILLYLLGIIAIYFSIKKTWQSNTIIILIVSFFWMWVGIVYHLIFFTTINKAAYLFGILNIVQVVIFLYFGFFKKLISFHFHWNIFGWVGAILLLYALLIYPILGFYLGHVYPASPTFGLPCPTTIFTFGLLLWTDKKCPAIILIIPFLWSIVGFSAALSLGIWEDTGLLISGLIVTSLILARNRKLKLSHEMDYPLSPQN